MNRKVALRNLKDVNEVLEEIGATYWIDCGTLLGAIREGDFLEHDTDIDFGVWTTEHHEAIAEGIEAAGFKRWRFFGTPDSGYEQSFTRDGLKVDLFFFYPLGAKVWQGSWLGDHLIVSEFDRAVVLAPRRMSFRGLRTFVPRRPELMLEARYGEWEQVVREWDWSRDPRCITPASHPRGGHMAEQTFKLTAPNGTQVEVVGANRRDELVKRGYTETTAKKTTRKKTTK